jgi:TonB family protein
MADEHDLVRACACIIYPASAALCLATSPTCPLAPQASVRCGRTGHASDAMRCLRTMRLSLIALWLADAACAQVVPTSQASAAAPRASEPSALERAQRQTDLVFEMILKQGERSRQAPAVRPAISASPSSTASRAAPGRGAAPSAPGTLLSSARRAAPAVDPAPSSAAPVAATTPPAAPPPASSASTADVAAAVDAPTIAAPPSASAETREPEHHNTQLELIYKTEPNFPTRLTDSLGSGSVVVDIQVRPDGSVASARVVRSSHPGLERAAQEAVLGWRFKPISETVSGRVEISFE